MQTLALIDTKKINTEIQYHKRNIIMTFILIDILFDKTGLLFNITNE